MEDLRLIVCVLATRFFTLLNRHQALILIILLSFWGFDIEAHQDCGDWSVEFVGVVAFRLAGELLTHFIACFAFAGGGAELV